MHGDDLAVITKTMAISVERSAVECAGHSDEGIVPFDVGVTSDVGKGLWGVRDCGVHRLRALNRVTTVLNSAIQCCG